MDVWITHQDTLMNSLWCTPGGSGAKAFPTIGTCYQTVCCKDDVYAFTLSLSDKECVITAPHAVATHSA